MPIAIIGWDRMRLLTTRQTPLTGDAKTVAALNVMQIASCQVMTWCPMLDQDNLVVAIIAWEVRAVPLVTLLYSTAPSFLTPQRRTTCSLIRIPATRI